MYMGKKLVFSVFCICLSLAAAAFAAIPSVQVLGKNTQQVRLPIFMYHQVSERAGKWGKFVISPEEFEQDVKTLIDRGYTTVTVNDLIDYTEGEKSLPEKPVMLTFDDGYQSDFVYVLPIIQKYGVKIVCSTVGAYTELYSGDVHKHVNYAHLSWDEMRTMHESGLVEFQNHSYNLHNYDYNRRGCLKKKGESSWHYDNLLKEDFELSQQLYWENLGIRPACFTYPFGSVNDELLEHVRDFGFLASLGAYEKINYLTGDPEELYDLRRFNRPHNFDISRILDKAENG